MGFVQGLLEDYVLPAAHTAGGIVETAGLAEGSHIIPLLGTAVGLGQAGLNMYQMWNATNAESRNDHAGGAVLGALGAIPAVGSYVGAGELAWNLGAAGGSGGFHKAEENGANANQMIGRVMNRFLGDGAPIMHQRAPEGGGEHH